MAAILAMRPNLPMNRCDRVFDVSAATFGHKFYLGLLLLLAVFGSGWSLQTPLTINVQRNWRIPANKEIGQYIDKVRVNKVPDPSKLVFELGDSVFKDGSDFFRIDRKSGVIQLDESLAKHVGETFFLFVKASYNDGPTSSLEVRVDVEDPDEFANGGVSSSLPQFPGPERPFMPARPMPVDQDDDTDEDLSSDDLTPTNGTSVPTEARPGRGRKKNKNKDAMMIARPDEIMRARKNETKLSETPSTTRSPRRTTSRTTATTSPPVISETLADSNKDANKIGSSTEANATSAVTSTLDGAHVPEGANQSMGANLTLTIVPIIVIVGTAPLVGLIIWILRRKYSAKKEQAAPETTKKEVSGELNSVDTTDEGSRGDSSISTSPSGLMQWHRALSNRYESTGPGESAEKPEGEQNKWEFPRHHLRILGILGEGCFGQVWKCEALNVGGVEGTTTVAVKTLKENAGEREKRDLLSELEVMKMLDPHPNIVTLLGCCTIKEPVFVILEYIQHGKLQSYLRSSRAEHYYGNLHGKSSHLTSRDLTSFAFQVAKGMDYLTSKGIIHRDLAARNVLVGAKNICKVADFGFARDLVGNGVYERKSEGRLPIRWMAPESLYDNVFTAKTDVWSFGILMWEIVTLGSTPYPGMAAGEVMRKVRDGYRLEKPDHCRREIYNIMYYCWDRDPNERPSFSELTHLMDQLLSSETDYIELDRFPDHAYYNIISNLSGEKL